MFDIRNEIAADIPAIHTMNKQAFGRAEEAILVDRLRKRGALIISLVATSGNEVVGHIAFTDIILDPAYPGFTAASLAPVAVSPGFQKQGAGKELIRAGLELCRQKGYDIVIVIGHPSYYPRFGFKTVDQSKLLCEYEVPVEAYMVIELKSNALAGKKTMIKFQPEFRDAV